MVNEWSNYPPLQITRTCWLCQQPQMQVNLLKWLLSWRFVPPPQLCASCYQQLAVIDPATACQGCGRAQAARSLCSDCQAWRQQGPLVKNRALYCYDNWLMKYFFEQYKFNGDLRLRNVFALHFSAVCRQHFGRKWRVVPIPSDAKRFAQRGFNHVAALLTVPLTPALIKLTPTVAQASLTRQQRLQRSQPFAVAKPELIAGQKVVIVDDIYTTGATLYHAQAALVAAGASQVRTLTLCR